MVKKYKSKKVKKAQQGDTLPMKFADMQAIDPDSMSEMIDEISIAKLPKIPLAPKIKKVSNDLRPQGMLKPIDLNSKIAAIGEGRDLSHPTALATPKNKKPLNWSNIATTALAAADLLIPEERPQWPVVQPTNSYNQYQYGTGSQAIAEDGIRISKTGYKKNSKDKNKSKLRIPSNKITMEDVEFLILGKGSDGTTVVMQPGENYIFPNAEYVDETPLKAQDGATMTPEQMKQFNRFNKFVREKGYDKSPKLNNQKLSKQLYDEFKSQNPDVVLNYEQMIPLAQQHQHMLKQTSVDFLNRKNDPNAANLMSNITQFDGKYGPKTNSYDFPEVTLFDYHNNQLKNKSNMGYFGTNKQKTITLPKGKKIETLVDASGTEGKFYENEDGDLVPVMQKGGKMMANKGLSIEDNKFTPISDKTLMINGNSHEDGGTFVQYGDKVVEAEKGEPLSINMKGDAVIFGNMKNPITGNKFKKDAEMIAKKEKKVGKLMDYSTSIVNNVDPFDKWGSLKFNAAKMMMMGAKKKEKELMAAKEHLGDVQDALLSINEEQAIARNGKTIKAQDGSTLAARKHRSQAANNTSTETPSVGGINPRFQEALKKMLEEAPDFVKNQGYNIFSGYRDSKKQKSLWEASDKTGKWVAAPGKSEHEYGIAGDLQDKTGKRVGKGDQKAMKWLHENAKNYGLQFRMKHEPWHVSLAPDEGAPNWVGEYRPENYDANPANNIMVKRGVPYTGPKNPNGRKNEEFSAAEIGKLDRLTAPVFNTTPEVKQQTSMPDYQYNWNLETPKDIPVESDAKGLDFQQVMGEIYAGATNREEPVWLQQYNPELFQDYEMSLQDRRNRITSQGRASRQYLSDNAGAQAILAAEEYNAIGGVDAEEFRINQQISNNIVNKNKLLLNEAQGKNLQLADQQYVRQSTARSKTKATNQAILNSISSKILQNKLENSTLQVYENLYPHFRYNEQYQLKKEGNPGQDYLNTAGLQPSSTNSNTSVKTKRDASGTVVSTEETNPGWLKTQKDMEELTKYKNRSISQILNSKKANLWEK